MENHYNEDKSNAANPVQQLDLEESAPEDMQNISYDTSSSSNHSANPTADHSNRDSSRNSSSESDFERFGQEELAESDSRRLSEFGSRLANEVLNQVVSGQQEANASDLSTPNNEPTSPISNFMDERDLFVMPEAGKAEAHPATHSPTAKQGESHSFHDLESKLEEEEADLLGFGSSPNPATQGRVPQPADYDELISSGDRELHLAKQTPPAEEEQEEEDMQHIEHDHYSPSSPTIHEEETYPHDSSSGQDTLSKLPSETMQDSQQESEKSARIPESSSVTGMRDLSEDHEESTYERRGPLTIPASALTVPVNQPSQEESNEQEDEEGLAKTHNWPRPPTPPKELSEPEEEKPSVVDLGPPLHPHHLTHRNSEKGLPSILKKAGPWVDFQHLDPKVLEIIYWRDPKRSGGALAVLLVTLYLFAKCSLLSLVAYTSLAALAGTVGFRVFKLVEGQIKKTDGSNPFKPYLEQEISVPQERLHSQVDVLVEHGQALFKHLRHLFLVENLLDSVKFGMLLYTLTYVSSWFSGISLVLMFIITLFTVPKFYEVYKEPVDHYFGLAKENIEKVQHQITDKLPFLKKVAEGEKKEQ